MSNFFLRCKLPDNKEEKPHIYLLCEGENYEGYNVVANHLDREKLLNYAREYLKKRIPDRHDIKETLYDDGEIIWSWGCDYLHLIKQELNYLP